MQKILTVLALGLGLSSAVSAASQQAALLVYRVWEPGLDPYVSRVLVTPEFVRMDEGEGAVDFTLYDREQDVMYNVSGGDRSILVMNPPIADFQLPEDLQLDERVTSDEQAPKIAGLATQHVSLLANGEVCREMVTVPGLLPEALEGLRDFQALLGRIQYATRHTIPADMQTSCDLAENIYAPLRGLSHGMPIQDRSAVSSRSLVDFVPAYQVEAGAFMLPEDYGRIPMPGLADTP